MLSFFIFPLNASLINFDLEMIIVLATIKFGLQPVVLDLDIQNG